MNYKTMNINDIIDWCKEHDELEWLKKAAASKTVCEVYPKTKVAKKDEDGNVLYTKKGKVRYVSVADKSKKPTTKSVPITFVELKKAFCERYMPEIIPTAKEKKESFHKLIAKL